MIHGPPWSLKTNGGMFKSFTLLLDFDSPSRIFPVRDSMEMKILRRKITRVVFIFFKRCVIISRDLRVGTEDRCPVRFCERVVGEGLKSLRGFPFCRGVRLRGEWSEDTKGSRTGSLRSDWMIERSPFTTRTPCHPYNRLLTVSTKCPCEN